MIRKILLDPGHGKETPGKRSPKWEDGTQLFEWEYCREIAKRVLSELKAKGVDVEQIVTEDTDISLTERCNRTNAISKKVGVNDTLLVSIHCNAANGVASGWEIHTSPGVTKSDEYADIFWFEAQKTLPTGTKMRGDFGNGYKCWDNNFTVLSKSNCPAVLTENLFMDNKSDCKYLLSEEGKNTITKLHVNAILKIVGKL
jgi:N-acetylmuramoyl-L-alanine amidase